MTRCPFCGSTNLHFVTYGGGVVYARVCLDCAARGPAAHTRDEATTLWDTRAPFGPLQEIPAMIRRDPPTISDLQEQQ